MNLAVTDLEKIYRGIRGETRALCPTSFTVESGEFVSMVGPSGCGKSTTLYMIAGLESASGGSMKLDGEEITGPGPDRGMVFQNYTLFPWLTVRENALFAFDLNCNINFARPTGQVLAERARAEHLLELMGLADFMDSYPRELSGGMKQRVAIARALATKPKVLLMDEPFGALDAQTREEMQELMLLLGDAEKTTALFVTHDVDEAIYLSTRLVVFSGRPGRILKEIKVPFGAEREPDLKLTPDFLELKREILSLLQHQRADAGQRADLLRKLTQKA